MRIAIIIVLERHTAVKNKELYQNASWETTTSVRRVANRHALHRCTATIDRKDRASHPGRFVRGQIDSQVHDIFWRAHTADGMAVNILLPLRRFGFEVRGHRRLHTAWTDGIDAHLVSPLRHRTSPCQARDAHF